MSQSDHVDLNHTHQDSTYTEHVPSNTADTARSNPFHWTMPGYDDYVATVIRTSDGSTRWNIFDEGNAGSCLILRIDPSDDSLTRLDDPSVTVPRSCAFAFARDIVYTEYPNCTQVHKQLHDMAQGGNAEATRRSEQYRPIQNDMLQKIWDTFFKYQAEGIPLRSMYTQEEMEQTAAAFRESVAGQVEAGMNMTWFAPFAASTKYARERNVKCLCRAIWAHLPPENRHMMFDADQQMVHLIGRLTPFITERLGIGRTEAPGHVDHPGVTT
jgi:hypothetical protein